MEAGRGLGLRSLRATRQAKVCPQGVADDFRLCRAPALGFLGEQRLLTSGNAYVHLLSGDVRVDQRRRRLLAAMHGERDSSHSCIGKDCQALGLSIRIDGNARKVTR